MKLVETIEQAHSSAQRDKIVRYVGSNPKRFAELVDVYLKGPYRITQRSAWPLSYCIQVHPELVKPHLKTILQFSKRPGVHDAVKRRLVRHRHFLL